MAHLLEEYAKNLGVKISQPVINDHFFPLRVEKYITISQESSVESKVYPYYPVVINLLKPFLERAGIKIVQLGGATRIEGVDEAFNLSFKQQNYILSNSLAHIGVDGVSNHVASAKNIPTITLFGNTFAETNKPLFAKSASKAVNLSPIWKKKPCFSPVDPQKQIENIFPEVIAQSVLDFLNIEKEDIYFSTKHIGRAFLNQTVEVVPTSFVPLSLPQNQILTVRSDYGVDESSFMEYCRKYKVSICAKNLIQPHGLQQIANNISTFFLFVNKNWDDIPDNYFNLLKNANIQVVILVEDSDEIPFLRNKYFDIPVRPYYENNNSPCEVTENTQFLSSLRVIEGGKEYLSYAHWKKGLDRNNKVLDTADYWRELDNFYIYEPS
tara:strand:- start:1361 stop:2506 length:1146 start_codon:yes stop_codon:yes gene_type:complete